MEVNPCRPLTRPSQMLNAYVVARKTMRVNCSVGLSTYREETTLTLRPMDEPVQTPPRRNETS